MNSAREVRQRGSSAVGQLTSLPWGFGRQFAALLAVLATVAVGIGVFHAGSLAEPAQAPAGGPTVVPPSKQKHRVIAYYFHGNLRCYTCKTMEAYSREAIESAFAKELKKGRLVWQPVNIDIKGNEHFAQDYKIYTRSLVLVSEVRGKPAQFKNLEKIWQLVRDKEAFFRYVQEETRSYLTERS